MSERIGGMLTVLLGIIALSEAAKLYPYRTGIWNGDHAMPGIVGILLILLGTWLAVRQPGKKEHKPFPAKRMRKKLLLIFGSMMLFYFLVRLLGQILAVFLISALLFRWIGSYRWHVCALLSLGFTFVLDLVFVDWLQIPFPKGLVFR